MTARIKTRDEQRAEHGAKLMLSLNLEADLRLLASAILAGDSSKFVEFQQKVQYAPPEMKARLLEKLETGKL